MDLSEQYLYGCLFINKNVVFINKNTAYYGMHKNDYRKCDKKQYEQTKKTVIQRIEYIYDSDSGVNTTKKRVSGDVLTKMENIFDIPPENESFTSFYDKLGPFDRKYLASTRDGNEVNAIILCFFHINDFKMQQFESNSSQSYIVSEQQNINHQNLENTIADINNNIKIHPVYIDAEYKYDSRSTKLTRQLYLSDGNHRIMALRQLGYNGMIPAIICDYLPDTETSSISEFKASSTRSKASSTRSKPRSK